MEILTAHNYKELLGYLPQIKNAQHEWQLVDIHLTPDSASVISAQKAAELVATLFKDKQGKLYTHSAHEILMLIHWGTGTDPLLIPQQIEGKLPAGSCKVTVQEVTPQGLGKLELIIQQNKSPAATLASARMQRRENVVMIADDDPYMRALVKKGAGGVAAVCEAALGKEIVATYTKHNPDMLLLDIHMPDTNGMEILSEIKALDPDAYIIMLSADSSLDNVQHAVQRGAKNFMAKPFTKEKLLEHLKKSPSFT